jgi:hypothetical protein
MKLRNVRRRQWDRYVAQLAELDSRLPRRTSNGDPFDQDPIELILPGYHRTYLRIIHRQAVAWRRRKARYGKGDIW